MKNFYCLLLVVLYVAIILIGCDKANDTIPVNESLISDTDTELTKQDDARNDGNTFSVEVVPQDDDFVRVKDYIDDIDIDLKYAAADNFTGAVIYDFHDAYLRYGTVQKLYNVQDELKSSGLSLRIWDAFRPVSAQFRLWEICPDPLYVANPYKSSSSHSRGNTVDVTLVSIDRSEILMPTRFDDFSAMADRDYDDCPPEAAKNARFLEDIMVKYGFIPYANEWWHFTDSITYSVEEEFYPPIF